MVFFLFFCKCLKYVGYTEEYFYFMLSCFETKILNDRNRSKRTHRLRYLDRLEEFEAKNGLAALRTRMTSSSLSLARPLVDASTAFRPFVRRSTTLARSSRQTTSQTISAEEKKQKTELKPKLSNQKIPFPLTFRERKTKRGKKIKEAKQPKFYLSLSPHTSILMFPHRAVKAWYHFSKSCIRLSNILVEVKRGTKNWK